MTIMPHHYLLHSVMRPHPAAGDALRSRSYHPSLGWSTVSFQVAVVIRMPGRGIACGVLGNLLPSSSLSKRPAMTKAIVSLLLMGAEPHSLEQLHISSPFPTPSRFPNGHGPVGQRIQPTRKSESNFTVVAKSADHGLQSRRLKSH
jgi:hypothetical protein